MENRIFSYQVYTHSARGVVFYVGSGQGNRPTTRHARNKKWNAIVRKNKGRFSVLVVALCATATEARAAERRIIEELHPPANYAYNFGPQRIAEFTEGPDYAKDRALREMVGRLREVDPVKAHLTSREAPLVSGQEITAACGAKIEKSFAVLSLDTAFTVGHSVREIVSANTLLFCRKCFAAPLEGRYLYAITEQPEKVDNAAE